MNTKEPDISSILSPVRRHPRHLIDILQDIQSLQGYLSQEAMQQAAAFLGVSSAAVWGVATFYNQFRFTPPGRQPVRVCLGTACHLAGGQLVLEAVARELRIEVGGTTEDREFDLDRVACIGCCALAPVVTVGQDIYPRMTPVKAEELATISATKHDACQQ